LTSLDTGVLNTNCVGLPIGGSCEISAGSPFMLTNAGASTAISVSARGTIEDGSTSVWAGVFTAQLSSITPDAIQSTILGDGSVSTTQSGSFTVTAESSVPEPRGSASKLMLFGAAGFLVLRRKGRKDRVRSS